MPKQEPATRAAPIGMFTEREYLTEPHRVMSYARAHGRATVVRADGSLKAAIVIPLNDLPTLD